MFTTEPHSITLLEDLRSMLHPVAEANFHNVSKDATQIKVTLCQHHFGHKPWVCQRQFPLQTPATTSNGCIVPFMKCWTWEAALGNSLQHWYLLCQVTWQHLKMEHSGMQPACCRAATAQRNDVTTLLQVSFWSIWCLKDLKRCLPNFATWRLSKIAPSIFHHTFTLHLYTFISISSTSLLFKASCECYCSIGSLGPQIKGHRECQGPVDQAEDPNHDKGNRKACCHPVPCHPTQKGVVTMWEAVFFLHICRPYMLQLRTLAELLPSAVLLPGSQTAQTANLTCLRSAQAWSRLQVCDQIHGLLPCNTWSQVSLILFHSYWEWLKLSSWHADAALA